MGFPRDNKGRIMYPIPGLPGCYETAKARRERRALNRAMMLNAADADAPAPTDEGDDR